MTHRLVVPVEHPAGEVCRLALRRHHVLGQVSVEVGAVAPQLEAVGDAGGFFGVCMG